MSASGKSARPARPSGSQRPASWSDRARAALRQHHRLLAVLALTALGAVSCASGVAVAAWTRACAGGCPTAAQIDGFAPQQATEVYAANDELLGLFYRERRQVVPLDSLPPHVPLAFVAIEDRRFWQHEGIDLRRMVAAVRDNVIGGWGGPGGSTITMQLARNLFPQQLPVREKTLRRKFAEMRLAREIERSLSKEEILALYLNHIYLGSGAYGIEAAARTYFGKPASQLTPSEAALLAALPKAPSHYNPRRNPDEARQRRNLVLHAMGETGVLSPAEARALRREPLALAAPRGAMRAPYFVEHIRRELEDQFGELLYTGGLRIHTTLVPELQQEAEEALEAQLREVESGKYGHFRHISYDRFQEERGEQTGAVRTPYLQGVAAVLDPHTGDVLALVGGRDFDHSQFNRATQALRQPGSAFKPFVYGAALEAGLSPLYRLSDSPIHVPQDDGSIWAPRNYGGEYEGEMPLREALKRSKNMIAIRLGEEVGVERVTDFARRAGLDTPIPEYPSVFIGAAGVYPLELIASYGVFANGGMRVEPRFVRRIEDREGNVLWQPPSYPLPTVEPAVSWILTDMLRGVVDNGTGYNVRNPYVGNLPYEIPAAGKTGTTNDNTDVWFVGYTPDLLAGVWIGMDQPARIMGGATGGGLAAPVWARIARRYYEDHEPPPAWERPDGVAVRQISRWTGRPVTPDCIYAAGAQTDYFVAHAAPAPGCEPPRIWGDDPQPHLPGRPVLPGQRRVPQPGDYVDTVRRGRRGGH